MFFWKDILFLIHIHINSFKASLQSCHKKNNPNKSDIRNNPKRINKRNSERTFSFTSLKYQASMCLETSLALPVFLLFFTNVFSICYIYMTYMEDISSIHRQGKITAAYAYSKEEIFPKQEIRLEKAGSIELVGYLYNIGKYKIYSQCVVKPWVGYDVTKEHKGEKEESMVYITKHGAVYHKSRNCSYLTLSIQGISYQNMKQKRNRTGEKYEACQYCEDREFVTMVYITDYGNKYHTTTKCPGLKRSIDTIPLSQIKEKECCKKCG